jgi:hypothetical protein
MYEVLRKGRIHNLSIKCQLDLFDKIIKPIVFYCKMCNNFQLFVVIVKFMLFGRRPFEKKTEL